MARARDGGFEPRFWWRDDDAVSDTPALRRLVALAQDGGRVPALAVIPRRADASLRGLLEQAGWPGLVHGLSHANHAPAGEKKAEFGRHRPLSVLAAEAGGALEEARRALGGTLLPVFVPPWNRADPSLVSRLQALGYRGASLFGDRRSGAAEGLVVVNAHIDPIDWHKDRSLTPPDDLVGRLVAALDRRRAGEADPREPIGLLTHHLVHDEAVWRFCEAFMEELTRISACFALAEELFCVRQPDRLGTVPR
jgi:hypothetical protein